MSIKLRQCYIKDDLCYIPLNNGQEAFTDKEYFDKVSKYNWYVNKPTKFIRTNINHKTINLYKFLHDEFIEVKYKNNNKLDNRTENLIGILDRKCFIKDNICYIPLANCDKFAVCDAGNFDVVSKYKWHLSSNGYTTTTLYINQKNKNVTLHKMLLPHYKNFVDHINRDKLDNTAKNLREANIQQNSFNSGICKRNTSGYKGVYFSKEKHKYCAKIKKDYKHIHIGYYKTVEEAALAYNEKAKELFGEYAYLNEIKPVIKTVV